MYRRNASGGQTFTATVFFVPSRWASARKDMRKDMAFTIPYGHASTVHFAYKTLSASHGDGHRRLYASTTAVSKHVAHHFPSADDRWTES